MSVSFQINKPVFIKPLRSRGIVRKFENGLIVVDYFLGNSNKKRTHSFNPSMLEEYRAKSSKKDNSPYKKSRIKKIKIKYFADIEKIEKIPQGNWIDLRAAEDVTLKTGEYKLIPLGVGMKLPKGFEANIVSRSSTFKNWGIIQTNSYGVIDNSYSGNSDQWYFPAYATRDTEIKKGDRICQFRINRVQPEIAFEEVESLDVVSRGGFGSSGVK